MRRRKKQWLGYLIMVVGLALLLGPFIQGDIETKKQENFVSELRDMMNRTETRSGDNVTFIATEPPARNMQLPNVAAIAAAKAVKEMDVPAVTAAPAETAPVVTAAPAETAPVVTVAPAETVPVVTAAPTEAAPVATVEPVETAPAVTAAPAETEPVVTAALTEAAPVATVEPVETAPAVTAAPTEIKTFETAEPVVTATATPVMTEEPAPIETATPVVTMEPMITAEPTAAVPPVVPTEDMLRNFLTPAVNAVRALEWRAAEVENAVAAQATAVSEPSDPFYLEAKAYNRLLVEKGQDGMNSLSDIENFQLNAMNYGFSDNVIGTISIPRLNVEVALYLGATSDHMANGFAVFGMTSLPLGEGDENVAIAGHRGWRGTSMLRDVQKILIGDPVYITTPWRTLTYIVTGIEIVTPNNVNWCKIQPGRTMISLMTCHPYGQHTHRYIVYAELQEEAEPNAVPAVTHALKSASEVTPMPTVLPTAEMTAEPTAALTIEPTIALTAVPTVEPTAEPTAALMIEPTIALTTVPTVEPTAETTVKPTEESGIEPTAVPTTEPTAEFMKEPTATPTVEATAEFMTEATVTPTVEPAAEPTAMPTDEPTTEPAVTLKADSTIQPAMEPVGEIIPAVQEIVFIHDDGTREVILMDTSAVDPDEREYSTEWSDTLILAENSMRPVAYIAAALVAGVGFWLVCATIGDAARRWRRKRLRKKKRKQMQKRGKRDEE